MIGERIGSYRITRELGRGGMGAVYAAEHEGFGKKVAIKVLHATLTAREDILARFFNEARAAAAIDDPGIVQIFDVGTHDGSAYLVMELLTGETVGERARRLQRLPAQDAVRIARQVAATLGRAHAAGIVHRDLKPDNLFLVRDHEVIGGERTKVLDFGIAKLRTPTLTGTETSTGHVLGTPTYMSPEQCRDSSSADHRSDIYSLGCVLFRLLTGRTPFEASTTADLIAAHLRETAPPPSRFVPDLPEAIDAIVQLCLEKDPIERFASMTDLVAALDHAREAPTGPTVRATMEPTVEGAPPVVRNARIRAALAIGGAVAITAATIAWYATRADTPTSPEITVDAPVRSRLPATIDAAIAAPPDAGPSPLDASVPVDASRPHRRSADPATMRLPPDASPVIDVDLDNDGIPDRR